MIRKMIAVLVLLFAVPAAAQDMVAVPPGIAAAMADSAKGWSAGDLDRFLAVYAPDASFTTTKGVDHGIETIRERYVKSYVGQFGAGGAKRTSLAFTLYHFRALGADHALLVAEYVLTGADGKEVARGFTSVVLQRLGGAWKIVADHSS